MKSGLLLGLCLMGCGINPSIEESTNFYSSDEAGIEQETNFEQNDAESAHELLCDGEIIST